MMPAPVAGGTGAAAGAGLGQRRDGADLDEAEAECRQPVDAFAVLVEPGGEADRIGKSAPSRCAIVADALRRGRSASACAASARRA